MTELLIIAGTLLCYAFGLTILMYVGLFLCGIMFIGLLGTL